MSIQLKTMAEIEKMRHASMIVYEVLQLLAEMVSPGVTTEALDARAREECKARGALPAFLNYPAYSDDVVPFPGVICASANEVIVHGMPSPKPLNEGDILSIDFGVSVDGYFGDSALTVKVGKISQRAQKLIDVTRQSLEDGIAQCRTGMRIGDISHAVQTRVESNGFNVVREFVGHGIGTKMHEPPHIPNYGKPGQGRDKYRQHLQPQRPNGLQC